MKLREIERFFPELHEAIGKRGVSFRATAETPATEDAIIETERAIGITLADQYKELLRDCDGLTLAAHRSSDVLSVAGLRLFGTTELRRRSINVSQVARWLDEGDAIRAAPRIFVHFAGDLNPDSPLVFDRYRRAEGVSDDPVIAVDLYASEWVRGEWPIIASSFDEFLMRCIRSMLDTDFGFSYWDPLDPWNAED